MSFMYISDLWNIRSFVIVSLLLQIFLILYAPIRKQSRNDCLLWSAYLMANWVAPFAIGLISRNQGNSSAGAIEVEGALHAFWVSFLLLHFGCPDTMGAFSTDDSKLWGRYLASFIFQLGAAIYVFVKICPSDKSLVIPTILVLFAALIKNVERLWALYLTNIPRLREWALSKHTLSDVLVNKLVEELDVPRDGYSNEEETKLVESIVVKHAYCFFQIFKIFLVDLVFTHQQREISREYFCKVSAWDAMRIISVELQFMYEVLHTKLLAIHSKWSYIFRFIAFTNIVVAYVLFNRLKKNRLPELDVKITYALLLGGIALDVIALVMLVFSDWNVGRIKCCNTGSSKLDSFFHKLVSSPIDLKKPRFATCEVEPKADATNVFLDTPFIFRRWSESIYASNLFF
ncbi:hypothetical protein ACJRO7_000229 [Eucalyptus globulus]|uniref:DUF4220 domain-containing protein n=1 Tax=Eucalyptus globulus TaxID=34317 RepID=A0ABD3LSM2_EUCGL